MNQLFLLSKDIRLGSYVYTNNNYVAVAVVAVSGNSQVRFFDIILIASEYATTKYTYLAEKDLVKFVVSNPKLKMVNFDIQNGTIIDSCGKFSRLQDSNGVSPKIVVADIVTTSGRITGYILLDKGGRIVKYSKDDMLTLCSQAKDRGVSFIQNGIFRPTDETACIASYPSKPFIHVTVQGTKAKPAHKTYVDKKINKKNFSKIGKKDIDL